MSDIDDIISRLIISTHTKKRDFNLLEVSSDVSTLVSFEGDVKKAAQTLMISTSMLNQFLSINKLSPALKALVKSRLIDGVSVAYNLTKFSSHDQEVLAKMLLGKQVSSIDVRYLAPLRKAYPTLSVIELVGKLKSSENKRVSLIRFDKEAYNLDVDTVKTKFYSIVGRDNVLGLDDNATELVLKLTSEGEMILREKVRSSNSTLEKIVGEIVLQ